MTDKKTLKRLAAIAAVGALAWVPAQALAANVITNGTFNTDTAGWTLVQGGANPGTCTIAFSNAAVAGVTGGHAASSASNISQCGLYQQVTLAAGSTNTLTLDLGVTLIAPGAAESGRLEIRNAANGIIDTLYTRTGTQGADPVAPRTYNLDAYAGQTIRIYFFTNNAIGQTQIRVDNVVLDSVVPTPVPTMTEWAMILLGTLLAGGAALMIQRRRLVA